MAVSAPTDDWTGLADLLANLIVKYAPVLDLDEPTSPKTGTSLYLGVAHKEAA